MKPSVLRHTTSRFTTIIILSVFLLFSLSAFAQEKAGDIIHSATLKAKGEASFFTATTISDSTFERMTRGGSYPKGCQIKRDDLRYLRVLHVNFKGESQVGELVCNKAIAQNLLDIFRELYKEKYPIERMVLIDEYGADDETSMRANNTSCFCYRTINGSTKLSAHSRGMAIDINPLQNPCVRYTKDGKFRRIQPDTKEARNYIKRTAGKAHVITKNDLCYRLFVRHGFTWGGAWRTVKDYQHFEK